MAGMPYSCCISAMIKPVHNPTVILHNSVMLIIILLCERALAGRCTATIRSSLKFEHIQSVNFPAIVTGWLPRPMCEIFVQLPHTSFGHCWQVVRYHLSISLEWLEHSPRDPVTVSEGVRE